MCVCVCVCVCVCESCTLMVSAITGVHSQPEGFAQGENFGLSGGGGMETTDWPGQTVGVLIF